MVSSQGSGVDSGSAALGDSVALALVVDLRADARRLALLGIDRHDVGEVDRPLLLDHAADGLGPLGVADLLRALVALDDVQPLHVDLLLLGVDAKYAAGLAAVLAADDDHRVVAPDAGHLYSTSGASETIFMKLRSRNSRATGPKMRVPRGLLPAEMMTAALSSKRMWLPSGRAYSLATRTITAVTTSPFFTAPLGCASLTDALMMSPTPPYCWPEPPITRIHMISLAPVLSATLSRVCT